MAQTNFTPISIYYSATATNVPVNTNLVAGELAINTADGKLFYKDSSGVVQVLGTKGGVGSSTTTQVLYNSSGLVVGSANMTYNGTTLTLANDASISGLTVGKGGGSVSNNTAVGVTALGANVGGQSITAIGYHALQLNTLASGYANNTSVGAYSMQATVGGTDNTAVGTEAMYSNTSGSSNVSVGKGSLNSNTTASNNTAVGYQAAYSHTSSAGGQSIVAVGSGALYYGTGDQNTAVGFQAHYGASGTTTGSYNTSLGFRALYSNTTASSNTAVGYQALYANTTASFNTAIGRLAMTSNTTGASNSVLGNYALPTNTTGSNNVAIGESALQSNTTASYNNAIGYQAGFSLTTGSANICLGAISGASVTTGSNNAYIGYTVASGSAVGQELVIGLTASTPITGKGTNTGFISTGSGGVYQGNNSTLWSITSDQRLKKNIVNNTDGLNKITAIQVRNFEYRTADEVTELEPQNAIDIKGVQLGAIAQELQTILPDCVKTESTGVMSVDASNLTWYLVNAVKELKAEIDLLKAK